MEEVTAEVVSTAEIPQETPVVKQEEKPIEPKPEQPGNDLVELNQERKALAEEVQKAEENPKTQTGWESIDEKTKAQKIWDGFQATKAEWQAFKTEKGLEKPEVKGSKLGVVKNFFQGMSGDFNKAIKDRREPRIQDEEVKVTVLSRDEILEDPLMLKLLEEKNQQMMALLDKEVFREANGDVILTVEGVTPGQFRQLVRRMGHNPLAIASDRRGNNEGAIAVDNAADTPKQHPFYEKIKEGGMDEEMSYWKKVVKGLNWRMSRTHALIYGAKVDGKDVLFLPVHVDPKNWVAGLSAAKYHQAESLAEEQYTGTGLYNLGSEIIINLLRQAKESGLIKNLEVSHEDKIHSMHSISGDDRLTWLINKLAGSNA